MFTKPEDSKITMAKNSMFHEQMLCHIYCRQAERLNYQY